MKHTGVPTAETTHTAHAALESAALRPGDVVPLRTLLGPLLLLAAQALQLALVQEPRERLHGDGSENTGHVHRELDVPVGLGGESLPALLVDEHFGPLGLPARHDVARIPLAVAVQILDDAELDFAGRDIIEPHGPGNDPAPLLLERPAAVEQLDDILHPLAAADVDFDGGEFLGVEDGIFTHDGIVGEPGDVGDGSGGNGEGVLPLGLPGSPHVPPPQERRIADEPHGNVLDGLVGLEEGQQHGGRIEPGEGIIEIDGEVVFGIDFAVKRELESKGTGLPGLGPLLACLLGPAPLAFELLALALLLLGLDKPPRELQRLGDPPEHVDGIVLEISDRPTEGIGPGRTEVERVGGIGGQRVAQLHHDAAAAHRKLRFPAHGRGGEELFLLVLELHELVELDVNLTMPDERTVGGEVVGRHVDDDGGQRIAGPARGDHHAGAPAEESRREEKHHDGAQNGQRMRESGLHRREVSGFCSSGGA